MEDFHGIRTCTPLMQSQVALVRRFAPLDTPVLIQGETGTGKELIAGALHALSRRAAHAFVTVDCAALPETLAESELFGHERGAFTGADRSYGGRIEAATGGTVFLDEVNSISLGVQGKLLRFLEAGEFSRVGQRRAVNVDVRVVSACNVPLDRLVAGGTMRTDFYYRLNVLRIDVPPLRDRRDDLPLLVSQFLAQDEVAVRFGIRGVTPEVMNQLVGLPWPGNVRELRNLLRRSVALATAGDVRDGALRVVALNRAAEDMETQAQVAAVAAAPHRARTFVPFRAWMREREREYLVDLLRRHRSVGQQAAASGLPQRTLYRKLKDLGLSAAALEAAAMWPETEFGRALAGTEAHTSA